MSWSQIIGHRDRIDAFRRIVESKRLAHAYLFVGPPGIGKRRVATELAKALLCEGPGPRGASAGAKLEACDQCDACLLVDAGTHPDLFQVSRPEEKNEMPTEVMKDFCKNFGFKPARGRGKIGIVDDADDFNDESANCFLKTLEEPAPGVLLILIGATLDRQLATIKSRCHMVRFAPLPDAELRTLLQKIKPMEPALLDRVIRVAAGSPGQGLALADASLWNFRRDMLQGLAQAKVASVALGRKFVEFAEEAGKEGSLQRRRVGQALALLIASFTDVLRIQAGGMPRSAEAAELPLLEALAKRADADKITALLERCLETETQVVRYVQLSLVLEGLLDALGQMLENPGPPPLRYQGFAV